MQSKVLIVWNSRETMSANWTQYSTIQIHKCYLYGQLKCFHFLAKKQWIMPHIVESLKRFLIFRSNNQWNAAQKQANTCTYHDNIVFIDSGSILPIFKTLQDKGPELLLFSRLLQAHRRLVKIWLTRVSDLREAHRLLKPLNNYISICMTHYLRISVVI